MSQPDPGAPPPWQQGQPGQQGQPWAQGQQGQPWQQGQPVQQVCAFHPDRVTARSCTRCGRPACSECLTPAAVGFQCRACVAEGRAGRRQPRNVAGAVRGQQPLVTYVLIVVNILVFAICAGQAGGVLDVTRTSIFERGAMFPAMVVQGEYWRMLTSGFLHLGLVHVALNMISLYMLGIALERVLGRWRFLVVYLLGLLGGSVSVLLFSAPVSLSAGASGAIFGLMGALLVAFRRLRYDARQLVVLLAINLFITFQVSGISWQAHLGGLLIGAAAGAVMVYPPRELRSKVQIGGSALILVVLIVITAVAAPGIDDKDCGLESDGQYYCQQ
ncbi:rhomboid family intramembrane serine protease [Nakamurella sp. YIM 132087]|uniref:Rhomboid family intramembrane serine protease n=1 Tax=Nakamurella alba TaxID=2665158 RepID=A0A7K1FL13_9ACTN|nr:rhomboid family intramembrane serine protease [Nakamurella alba]MTD14750.1 rhomboid family intramembrane serine protease [Nakamurella alba]